MPNLQSSNLIAHTDFKRNTKLFPSTPCGRTGGSSGQLQETDGFTWGVQVLRYPNFFSSGMEADRNVKVVGGDVAVL